MLKRFDKNYYWIIFAVAGYVVSVSKLSLVLPSIMQDEYIYSVSSRLQNFQDQIYGNYIFNIVYSSTNLCGSDFYGCAKGLNSLFLALVIFLTFLISKLFLSVRTSAIIAGITSLSPIAIYSSFFMPDMMFYACALAIVYLAIKMQELRPTYFVLLLGLFLGAASLVKSHALFMLPALMIFVFCSLTRSSSYSRPRSLGQASLFAVTTIVSKIALGVSLAGTNGFSLFGNSYDGSLLTFLNSSAASPNISGPVALSQNFFIKPLAEQATQRTSADFLISFLWQMLMHGSVIAIFAFIPIVYGVSSSLKTLRKSHDFKVREQLVFLTTALGLSSLVLVSAFEAMVTVSGDNHDFRVITRYYDYLIPLVLIVTFSFAKDQIASFKYRAAVSVVGIAGIIFGITNYPSHLSPKYSDSPLIVGMLANTAFSYIVFFLAFAAIFFFLFSKVKNSKAYATAATALIILICGQLSLNELVNRNSNPAFFDVAGQEASKYLQEVPGDQIIVLGNQTITAVTPKFWIDKPNIASKNVEKGASISNKDVAGFKYVLLVGEFESALTGNKILEGSGFQLFGIEN